MRSVSVLVLLFCAVSILRAQNSDIYKSFTDQDKSAIASFGSDTASINKPAKKYVKDYSENYSRFRLSCDLGYGKRTAFESKYLLSNDVTLADGLKEGLTANLDVVYFFAASAGIGLKYSHMSANNSAGSEFTEFIDFPINVDEKLNIGFYGLELLLRAYESERIKGIYVGLSVGQLYYNDKCTLSGTETLEGESSGLGFELSAGADIKIYDKLSLNIRSSYLYGNARLESVKTNGEKQTINGISIDVSHFSIGAGFAINL